MKSGLKPGGHHAMFWVLEVKRSINIWFNFVFSSFFEQDHLLNLFISGVDAKG